MTRKHSKDPPRVPPPDGVALFRKTHIAGIRYYEFHDGRMPLDAGLAVELVRQPANKYDPNAIEIYTPGGAKLGYVPRRKNKHAARLMDAGWPLTGRIERVETPQPGLGDSGHTARRASIRISIFMPRYTESKTPQT